MQSPCEPVRRLFERLATQHLDAVEPIPQSIHRCPSDFLVAATGLLFRIDESADILGRFNEGVDGVSSVVSEVNRKNSVPAMAICTSASTPTAAGSHPRSSAQPRISCCIADKQLRFVKSPSVTYLGTNWGPHVMRDGERPARLCTSHTAANRPRTAGDLRKRVAAIYWGSSGPPLSALLRIEMFYRDGSLAGPQIVAQRWCGGCQGHTATRSAPGRTLTATAPPRRPALSARGLCGAAMHLYLSSALTDRYGAKGTKSCVYSTTSRLSTRTSDCGNASSDPHSSRLG
jgi:hypothetical protein